MVRHVLSVLVCWTAGLLDSWIVDSGATCHTTVRLLQTETAAGNYVGRRDMYWACTVKNKTVADRK